MPEIPGESGSALPEVPAGLSNVLFDVWLVSRATTAMLDDALHATGLDAEAFAVYSVLASSGDGMTPTQLARWMSAPTTTISSYIKRFEAQGHVRRAPNPDDGRSYLLQLTPAGKRMHRKAGERFTHALKHVTAQLGESLPTVDQSLHVLRQAIAAARRS